MKKLTLLFSLVAITLSANIKEVNQRDRLLVDSITLSYMDYHVIRLPAANVDSNRFDNYNEYRLNRSIIDKNDISRFMDIIYSLKPTVAKSINITGKVVVHQKDRHTNYYFNDNIIQGMGRVFRMSDSLYSYLQEMEVFNPLSKKVVTDSIWLDENSECTRVFSGGFCYLVSKSNAKLVQGDTDFIHSGLLEIPHSIVFNSKEIPVTSIGDEAFNDCSQITSLVIPNSIKSIGKYAFRNCVGLMSVKLPDSVLNIGRGAFLNCTNLLCVNIPRHYTGSIRDVFKGCCNLNSINVDEGNPLYDSRENCNCVIATKENYIVMGCKNSTIPNSITSIGTGAFEGCTSLTSIDIPTSVISIGNKAFSGCVGISSVVFPSSVISIGISSFEKCTGLTSVVIPRSVLTIGISAFEGCSALSSVTNLSRVPQPLSNFTFSHYGTLHVSSGCKHAYEHAEHWKNFIIIEDAKKEIHVDRGR